jgi:hypothetical protein
MLGLLVLGGAGAWWLFRDESRRAPVPAPHDDLDLVAALMDANAGEVTPDRLVATPDAVVLARASDRALVAVSTRDGVAKDGRTHLLAHLEAPARGLAYAAGQLWVTTGHEVEVVPIGGGEPRRVAELAKPRALAADERAVYVVDVDPGNSGLTHANAVLRISGDGKDRQSLGRSDGEISDLVVDDANVYWADQLEGSIVAVAKTGGPARHRPWPAWIARGLGRRPLLGREAQRVALDDGQEGRHAHAPRAGLRRLREPGRGRSRGLLDQRGRGRRAVQRPEGGPWRRVDGGQHRGRRGERARLGRYEPLVGARRRRIEGRAALTAEKGVEPFRGCGV